MLRPQYPSPLEAEIIRGLWSRYRQCVEGYPRLEFIRFADLIVNSNHRNSLDHLDLRGGYTTQDNLKELRELAQSALPFVPNYLTTLREEDVKKRSDKPILGDYATLGDVLAGLFEASESAKTVYPTKQA